MAGRCCRLCGACPVWSGVPIQDIPLDSALVCIESCGWVGTMEQRGWSCNIQHLLAGKCPVIRLRHSGCTVCHLGGKQRMVEGYRNSAFSTPGFVPSLALGCR